jgi:Zn-dependent protease
MASLFPTTAVCPDCRTELSDRAMACPVCHRLLYAEELERLAAEAERAEARGEREAALLAWSRALALLPPGSRQHATIVARATDLRRQLGPASPALAPRSGPAWLRRAGPFGVVLAFLLGKGKLLLFGLTKAGPILTMLASLGLYWTVWGWRFALGLIAFLYLHEIGHVAELRRLGVAASPPMFVPGLGAFVAHPPLGSRRDDTRVALAGPLWGLVVAAFTYAAYAVTGGGLWAALAQWFGRLTLLNLIPIPPLDGGTAIRTLNGGQRWLLVSLGAAILWATTPHTEFMLWAVVVLAAVRAFGADAPVESDWKGWAQTAAMLVAGAALAAIPAQAHVAP